MLRWSLVACVLLAIADLSLLIELGRHFGATPIAALMLATSLAGGLLAKRQGLGVMRRVHRSIQAGDALGPELAEGLFVLIGGALLVLPGFMTDLLGLSLLFPPSRRLAVRLTRSALSWYGAATVVQVGFDARSASAPIANAHQFGPFEGPVIDVGSGSAEQVGTPE